MIDALDTALSFGVSARSIEATFDHFETDALAQTAVPNPRDTSAFLGFVNAWVERATVLNELSRSMGQPDFYPFVLSAAAVRKLHFVHRVVIDPRNKHATTQPSHMPGTLVADAAH